MAQKKPCIEPKEATLGAVITDIDLARLDYSAWRVVEDAFHRYGLLIFPGQHLSDAAQVAFASRFGDLETVIAPISNAASGGGEADRAVVGDETLRYWILRGNERWHTDSSFKPLAAKASCLTAIEVPAEGGQTEWADMRAGYEVLDEALRRRIEGLCALHSNYYSHEQLGQAVPDTGGGYGFHPHGAPLRPLVKTHPVTGRKSLFIGRHAYGIPGMSESESEALLQELLDIAARPPRVTAHDWQPGDIAIWDNRCILHRVAAYDYTQTRIMRHTRVAGDPASELAGTLPDARASAYDPTGREDTAGDW